MTTTATVVGSTANGILLYDSEANYASDFLPCGLRVTAATLKKELNKASSLSITAVSNGAGMAFTPFSSYAQVVVTDGTSMQRIFFGRLTSISEDINGEISMECEGFLSFLEDTVVFPWELPVYNTTDKKYVMDFSQDDKSQNYQEMSIKQYMGMIAVEHNDQTNGVRDPRYLCGVSAEDAASQTKQIFVRDGLDTPLSVLENDLVDYYGGYLVPNVEDYAPFDESKFITSDDYRNSRVLSYYPKAEYVSGQTQDIQYGVNLIDFTMDQEPDDYFTRLLPIGEDDLYINGGKVMLMRMAKNQKIIFDLPRQSLLLLAIRSMPDKPYGQVTGGYTMEAEDGGPVEDISTDHDGTDSAAYPRGGGGGGSGEPVTEDSADWNFFRLINSSAEVISKKWILKCTQASTFKIWYQLEDLSKNTDEQTPETVDQAEAHVGSIIDDDGQGHAVVRSPFLDIDDTSDAPPAILRQETFGKIRKPKSLYKKARAYLKKYANDRHRTYSLTVIDMHLVDPTNYPHPFRIGQKLKIIGPDSGIPIPRSGVTDICMSIEYDLFQIGQVNLEIGEPVQTLSRMTGDRNKGRKKS